MNTPYSPGACELVPPTVPGDTPSAAAPPALVGLALVCGMGPLQLGGHVVELGGAGRVLGLATVRLRLGVLLGTVGATARAALALAGMARPVGGVLGPLVGALCVLLVLDALPVPPSRRS